MVPNYVLGNPNDPANICERVNTGCTEPIFEAFGDNNGEVTIDIAYNDRNTGEKKYSPVTLRFTKVRAEFYDQTAIPSGDPGSKAIGKYTKKLEGISVVRAGREIDFGAFDFYDKTNNPYHRWWGCEIRFDPVLDELFGVANNKQQVELRKDGSSIDYDLDDAALTLWEQLNKVIDPTIKKMVAANKDLRKNSRSTGTEDIGGSQAGNIVGAVENQLGDDPNSETGRVTQTTDPAQLEAEARGRLIDKGIDNPTYEQVRAFLAQELTIDYTNLSKNGPFMDTDFSLGHVSVTVNTAHIFYSEFIEKMPDDSRLAFELFIASLAKAIDLTNIYNSEQNDELIQQWDYRLKSYLKQIRAN